MRKNERLSLLKKAQKALEKGTEAEPTNEAKIKFFRYSLEAASDLHPHSCRLGQNKPMRPLMKSIFSHILFFAIPLILVGEAATLYRAKKIQATPSLFYQPGEILIENGIIKSSGNSIKSPRGVRSLSGKTLRSTPD